MKVMLFLLLLSLFISPAAPASAADFPGIFDFFFGNAAPALEPDEAMLEPGTVIAARMKSVAAGYAVDYYTPTDQIRAIRAADALPDDFIPSDTNTISVKNTGNPVYIFFDNQNEAGILYVYSESSRIVMNADSGYAFCMHSALSDLSGLAQWDARNVRSMTGIFSNDTSLPSLRGLENWDTGNLTDLSGAFYLNSSLTDISALKGWNTGKVRNMSSLFAGASALQEADALSGWNTAGVTDMSFMFSECLSLTSIDVASWDTGNVTDMTSMFQVGASHAGNGMLSEIRGLENWNVSRVTDMTCMFYGAGKIVHYDIANWDVSGVRSFNHMFCDNFALESLDLSAWNVQNVKTMYDMFDDCQKLTTIGDVSHWNTAELVDLGGWLNGAYSFTGDQGTLDLSGWNTSRLKVTGEAFRGTGLETIDLSGWTFDSITNERWQGAGRGIYYEYGNQFPEYPGMNGMFKDSKKLTAVYVSQAGLVSFGIAVINGVSVNDMWTGTLTSNFSVISSPN